MNQEYWEVVDTYKGIERADAKVIIVDEKGELVGTTSTRHWGKVIAEERAVLIVKSVNCHNELLEACKRARQAIAGARNGAMPCQDEVKQLERVIAKAEGHV